MDEWFVCSDGARLHVREEGDPDAEVTLVLVHCYALDLRAWDPVVAPLAGPGRIRLLRYDHRGHGRSERASAGTSVARLADDLAELLAARVPHGPVVLAGHSLGGMAVMAMADRHPDVVAGRVAGVVFLSTSSGDMRNLSLGLPHPLAAAALCAERWGVGALTALGRHRLPLPARLMDPFTRWLGFGPGARGADVAAVSAIAGDCDLAVMTTLRRDLDDFDCQLALITFDGLPVVVVVGDEDRVTPVRHSAVISRRLPGARLVVLPGAGHMLVHECPEDVVGLIEGVLRAAVTGWRRVVEDGWQLSA